MRYGVMAVGAAVGVAGALAAESRGGDDRGGSIFPPQSYTDTFDRRVNGGGWVIDAGSDTFPGVGGNPGWYIRAPKLVAPAPNLRTTGSSVFTGDYRQRGVEELGADLTLFSMQWPLPANTNVFLGLWNGNGTPNTSLDDLAVFGDTGGRIPSAGDGWRSYDIAVRSSSERLPSGWIAYSAGFTYPPGTREADKIWQRVIGDVEQVMWSYGGPGTVNFLGSIDAGADNCSIVWQSAWQRGAEPTACSGDVTGPQDEPDGVIALDDLLAVLADFGAVVSDPSEGADATGDSRVDLDDLLLVLARFGTECS